MEIIKKTTSTSGEATYRKLNGEVVKTEGFKDKEIIVVEPKRIVWETQAVEALVYGQGGPVPARIRFDSYARLLELIELNLPETEIILLMELPQLR